MGMPVTFSKQSISRGFTFLSKIKIGDLIGTYIVEPKIGRVEINKMPSLPESVTLFVDSVSEDPVVPNIL